MLTIKKDRPDFNYKTLRKGAIALLGPKKASELLDQAFKSNRGFLNLLAHMGHACAHYRKTPDGDPLYPDSPLESPQKNSGYTMAQAIEEFNEVQRMGTFEGYRQHLGHRIRSPKQFETNSRNKIELVENAGGEGTKLQVILSTKSLGDFVKTAEETGKSQATFKIEEGAREGLRNRKLELVWRDELTSRPEVIRLQIGNQFDTALALSKENRTSVKTELLRISEQTTGKSVPLTNSIEIDDVVEDVPGSIRVSFRFPEIQKKITQNEELSQGNENKLVHPGLGTITDKAIRNHAAENYGCNGRDLVDTSNEIAISLEKEVARMAAAWHKVETPSQEQIQEFLEDYTITALTGKERLQPKTRIESLSRKAEIPTQEEEGSLYARYTKNASEAIQTKSNNIGQGSPSELGGKNLLDRIARKEIEEILEPNGKNPENDYYARVAKELGTDPETFRGQHRFMLETWFGVGVGEIERGTPNLTLKTPFLTESDEEDLEEEREKWSQMRFQKGGTRAETEDGKTHEIVELEVGEWIAGKGTVDLSMPNEPALLHRLTRNAPRRDGLPTPNEMGQTSADYMPRIFRKNLTLPKKLEDLLTPEGKKDLEEKRINGSDNAHQKLDQLQKMLSDWSSRYKPLRADSPNPTERRLTSWLLEVAQENQNPIEGETAKANRIEEINSIFTYATPQIGFYPRGAETPSWTQNVPARSSALPLKLLCGTGYEELADSHNDLDTVKTMAIRWANANAVNCFEDIQPEKKGIWQDLIGISEKPEALVEHSILAEILQTPDWSKNYWDGIGLPKGKASLPTHLKALSDLVGDSTSSPQTMQWAGEETPIADVIDWLQNNLQIQVGLDESEKEKAKEAVTKDGEAFLAKIEKAQNAFLTSHQKIEGELNKTVGMLIQTSANPEEDTEIDELENVLSSIQDLLPAQEKETSELLTVLLAQKREIISLEVNGKQVQAAKSPNGQWKIPGLDAQTTETVLKRIEAAEAILKNPEDPTLTTEQKNAYQTAKNLANEEKIQANREIIFKAIETLPKSFQTQGLTGELVQATLRTLQKLENINQLERNLELQTKNWEVDLDKDNKVDVWNATQGAIFNAEIEVQQLLNRIFQNYNTEENITKNIEEFFSKEEIDEASKRLQTGDKAGVAQTLQAKILTKTKGEKAEFAQTISELRNELSREVSDQKENVEKLLQGEGSNNHIVSEILLTKHTKRLEETKIRQKVEKIRQVILSQINDKKKETKNTIEPEKLKQIKEEISIIEGKANNLPTIGSPHRIAPLQIAVDIQDDKTTITTNKVWAKAWLQTPEGKKNLTARINLAKWLTTKKGEEMSRLTALETLSKLGYQTPEENIQNTGMSEAADRVTKELGDDLKALELDNSSPVALGILVAHSTFIKTDKNRAGKLSDKTLTACKKETPKLAQEEKITTLLDTKVKGRSIESPYEKVRQEKEGGKANNREDNLPTRQRINRSLKAIQMMDSPQLQVV